MDGTLIQGLRKTRLQKSYQFLPHINPTQSQDLTNSVLHIDSHRNSIIKNKRIRQGSEFVKNTIKQWKQDISINIDKLDIKQFCNDGFATERKKKILIEDIMQNKSVLFKEKRNTSILKAQHIKEVTQNQNTMKMLQSVKIYNCFQDFQFPGSISQIIELLRQRSKEKPFKQIFKIMEPYITSVSQGQDMETNDIIGQSPNENTQSTRQEFPNSPQLKEKQGNGLKLKTEARYQSQNAEGSDQQSIQKSVVIGQREQLKLLLSWFDQMMIDCSTNKMDQLFVIAFAMGDLIQMSYIDCVQKGQLLLRMLKHFLNSSLKQINKNIKEKDLNQDLQQQLKRKDNLIKDMGLKVVKQKLRQKALMKELEELKSEHSTMSIAYEMLERRLETEKQANKKQHVQLLEKLYNKQEDQKNVLVDKVNDMFAIKLASNPEPLTVEQSRKQKEKYYVKKFGRRDDITLEIIHKHQVITQQEAEQKQNQAMNPVQQPNNNKLLPAVTDQGLDLTELPPSFMNRRVQTELLVEDKGCGVDSQNEFLVSVGTQVSTAAKYSYDIELDAIQEFKATINQEIQTILDEEDNLKDINMHRGFNSMPLDIQYQSGTTEQDNVNENNTRGQINNKSRDNDNRQLSSYDQIGNTIDQSNSQFDHKLMSQNSLISSDKRQFEQLSSSKGQLQSQDNRISSIPERQNNDFLTIQVQPKNSSKILNKQQSKRLSSSSSRLSNIVTTQGKKQPSSSMGIIQKLLNKINKDEMLELNLQNGVPQTQHNRRLSSQNNKAQKIKTIKPQENGINQNLDLKIVNNNHSIKNQSNQQNKNNQNPNHKNEKLIDILDNQGFPDSPTHQQSKMVHSLVYKHQQKQQILNLQNYDQNTTDPLTNGNETVQNNTINLTSITQDRDDNTVNQKILEQFNFKLKRLNNPLLNALLDSADMEKLFNILHKQQSQMKSNLQAVDNNEKQDQQIDIDQLQNYQELLAPSVDSDNEASLNNLDDTQIFQTEVPKILIRQAKRFEKRLSMLDKDEYGDFIIRPWDGDDQQSQAVVKQGRKLVNWIDRIRDETELQQLKPQNGVSIGLQTDYQIQQNIQIQKPNITISSIDQQAQPQIQKLDNIKQIKIKGTNLPEWLKYSQMNSSRDTAMNEKSDQNISYILNKKLSNSPSKITLRYSPIKTGQR